MSQVAEYPMNIRSAAASQFVNESRQIPSEIGGMHEAIGALEKFVTELETKLAPAMQPIPCDQGGPSPHPDRPSLPICEVAFQIRNETVRVDAARERIIAMIQRVEL